MDVRSLAGKTVLVTGAGSGIGRATALACARRGADLVLCDVNEAGLATTAADVAALGRKVTTDRVDVSRDSEMRVFADRVHRDRAAVDLLVNNAGVGLGAGFLETSLEDWDWILGINLRGVLLGCHYFVPGMVARGMGGHVVNVASMVAFTPSEALNAYATTKSAVLGFSEALADELQWHRIGVTAVCPGFIDTPIVESTVMRGKQTDPKAREQARTFYRRRGYTADRVAENLLRAVQRGRVVAPISPESWIAYALRRISPSGLRWVLRQVGKQMRKQLTQIQ